MKHYLLDTNILIYYFNGNMEHAVKDKVSMLIRENFQISVISKMEFLGFPFNLQERQKAEQFIEYLVPTRCVGIHAVRAADYFSTQRVDAARLGFEL
jgi:predicted nucleic acid-binding protein